MKQKKVNDRGQLPAHAPADVRSGAGEAAPTEDALLKQVAAHAADAHGVKEITPELAAQVKAAIKDA